MSNTADDLVTLFNQRREVLVRIVEAPTDASTLTEEASVSRSTIDRALTEFEEWGLITTDADRIKSTLFARLVTELYDDFEVDAEAIVTQATDGDSIWRTVNERTNTLRLVANRLDLLECADTSHDKRTLVAELPYARSTVDWAVRELEGTGLVQRTADGYATTVIGRRLADRYRNLLTTFSNLLGTQNLLAHLPVDCMLPPALFAEADIEQSDENTSFRLLAGVRDRLDAADRIRIVLPALPNPQLLDVCHHQVVRHGATLEFIADPGLADTLTNEFPGPLAEMNAAVAGTFTAYVAPVPPLELLFTETAAGRSVSVVVYAENRAVVGAIHTERDAAVEWADGYYERLRDEASEITNDLRSAATANTMGPVPLSTVADPNRLEREAEGFVRLTPSYFAQHPPVQPALGWRAGFELVDVHAGYAIEREIERDGTRISLTDDIVDRLDEGTDHAVIGSPGSGKSTACKMVACQWYERGIGPVFYRESGTGAAFESPAVLSAQLRTATSEGHVLVVVEDAVRAEANTIVRVMQSFQGTTMVTFLLDARESEWNDPPAFPTDARLDAYRTEAIETVTMPPLDEPEAERIVQHFQDTVGHEVDNTGSRLLWGAETDIPERMDVGKPAELLLLLHRLTLQADPLAGDDARTPTTLVEDVQQTYEELRATGDDALDVGVLLNLLNATDLGIHPALVYALAGVAIDENGSGERFDAVHGALSSLEGQIIFAPSDETDEAQYRTVHEVWSQLFLDYLLDTADTDHEASQRFGRCVTALLALTDDSALRARISAAVGDDASAIDQIESAPGEWADAAVEQIFHLGRARPGLAPLFGTNATSTIALPSVCSPGMEARCAAWRGRMYLDGGYLDQATREFERAIGLVDDEDREPSDLATSVKAESYKYLGSVAWQRGELDRARTCLTPALANYRAVGDQLREASCYGAFGAISLDRGELDRAAAYCERALASFREIGASRKNLAMTLHNLGWITALRGDLDGAETSLQRSIDIGRDLDGYFKLTFTFSALGEVSRWRGNIDRAERYYKQGIDVGRDVGTPRGIAYGLLCLCRVTLDLDNLETAREYVQRSLDISRVSENVKDRSRGYRYLGVIARKEERFADAKAHFTDSLSCCSDSRYLYGEAKTLIELGELARCRGDLASAQSHFTDAVERFREMGAVRDAVDSLERLTETCEGLEEYDAAIDHAETAIALGQEVDFDVPHAAATQRHTRLTDGVFDGEADSH